MTKAEMLDAAALDVERLLRLVRTAPDLSGACAELETMDRDQRDAVLLVALVNLARADRTIELHTEMYQAATSVLRRG